MNDPFKIQSNPKSNLRILDYRNCKYQGQTISTPLTRQGLGMILDHNFLLTLGIWKNGVINGECFLLFPDSTYFYGNLKSTIPDKLSCFHTESNCVIYSLANNNNHLIVMDSMQQKTLQILKANPTLLYKLFQQPALYQNQFFQEYNKNKQKEGFLQQIKYQNEQQKWKTLERFCNQKIKTQFKNYKSFIRHSLAERQKQQSKIQIIQTKQQFQFKFKNSSIWCKIYNSENTDVIKIKNIGFYDQNNQRYELSKKYNYSSGTIDQNIMDLTVNYPQNVIPRSKQCITAIHNYYIQSLFFVNQCLPIDYLYRIKFIYQALQKFFDKIQGLGYNEKQLSISRISLENQRKSPPKLENAPYTEDYNGKISRVSQFVDMRQFDKRQSLDKIKIDIYRAANKTNISKKRHSQQVEIQKNIKGLTISRSNSNRTEDLVKSRSIYQSPKLNHSYAAERDQPVSNKKSPMINRSYVYLPQDKILFQQNQYSNKIKRYEPGKIKNKHQKTQPTKKLQLSKFAYLEKESHEINKTKIENMKTLTAYYQEIQKQLRKESHKQTKQQKKSNSKNNMQLNKKLFDNTTPYKNISKIITNQTSTGAKKILKYNWD